MSILSNNAIKNNTDICYLLSTQCGSGYKILRIGSWKYYDTDKRNEEHEDTDSPRWVRTQNR